MLLRQLIWYDIQRAAEETMEAEWCAFGGRSCSRARMSMNRWRVFGRRDWDVGNRYREAKATTFFVVI